MGLQGLPPLDPESAENVGKAILGIYDETKELYRKAKKWLAEPIPKLKRLNEEVKEEIGESLQMNTAAKEETNNTLKDTYGENTLGYVVTKTAMSSSGQIGPLADDPYLSAAVADNITDTLIPTTRGGAIATAVTAAATVAGGATTVYNEYKAAKKAAAVASQFSKEKTAISAAEQIYEEGSFSIIDWSGYPDGPKPEPPFRMLDDQEYNANRTIANQANKEMHMTNPELAGKHIHEIKPVKFGGDPVNPSNKLPLNPKEHQQYTNWWNRLLKKLQ